MSNKTLNKKTKSPYNKDEIKERNTYADKFIKDLRKLKEDDIKEVDIDFTKIKIKQSVKLIKMNLNEKLVLITDEGNRYFLNDRTVSQIMKKKMDGDLADTEQHDDEYDETKDLETAKTATLQIIKGDVKSKPGGGFFKYTHNTEFDLTRYDIYSTTEITNYKQAYRHNCLYTV